MFKIGTEETFPEVPNVNVWSDDEDLTVLYALPDAPRLRTRDGLPQFKFVKYRGNIGEKKGGFVFFDADLSLDEESSTKLVELWQARLDARHAAARGPGDAPRARLGTMTYTKGTVRLLFEDGGQLVSRVAGAAKPSLYGSNVASFMLEIDERQSPILEAAMQGIGASAISVVYDLYLWAAMPPAEVTVKFHAERFESYVRTTDVEDSWWFEDHYNDNIEAELESSESGSITVNVAPGGSDDAREKLADKLRDWGFRMLNEAIAKQAANILSLIPEEKKNASQTYLDKLGGDDLDDLLIELDNQSFFDFTTTYSETSPVEWNLAPNGFLPAIESITRDGKPLKWEDFVVEVEPDVFFDELHIYAKVNADFDRLPLHSVQINIEHDGEKLAPRPLTVDDSTPTVLPLIDSADDVLHFADFVDGVDEVAYWFEVNYRNESQTFVSDKVKLKAADREPLVVNLDETGILSLDVAKGDIDFEVVSMAEVVVRYHDPDAGIGPLEQRYFIDKDTTEAQKFQHVIFGPRNRPFEYEVTKLRLTGGTEIAGPRGQLPGPTLHVDDIFTATRTIRASGVGDFVDDLDRIEVNLDYREPGGYTLQNNVTLREGSASAEWPIRVTALDAGTVSYDGQIFWKSGETKAIEPTTPPGDSFAVGETVELRMTVTVLPDGLFVDPAVTRAIFSGRYTDPITGELQLLANQIVSRGVDGTVDPSSFEWVIGLSDDRHRSFEWSAKILTTAGVGPDIGGTTDQTVLVPSLP